MVDVLEQFGFVEADFHDTYGIDLEEVWSRKSWRWFAARVRGLLAADTRLARYFAPPERT